MTPLDFARLVRRRSGVLPVAQPEPSAPNTTAQQSAAEHGLTERRESDGRTTAPTGPLPDLDACGACDAPREHHGTRYATGVGWHEWIAPDTAQEEQRRRARLIAGGDAA